jgi:hypothetical protein
MNRTEVAQTSGQTSGLLYRRLPAASSLQAQSKFSRPNASGACRLQVGDTTDLWSDQRSALLYPAQSGSWSQCTRKSNGGFP